MMILTTEVRFGEGPPEFKTAVEEEYLRLAKSAFLSRERDRRQETGKQLGEGLRISSPAWVYLQWRECPKYHVPSPLWSQAFLCEVLGQAACEAGPTVLEAGVLDAGDKLSMCSAWPTATILGLEPVPSSFARARERVNSSADCAGGRVRLQELGLSGHAGREAMHKIAARSGHDGSSGLFVPSDSYRRKEGGLVDPQGVSQGHWVVETMTLDGLAGRTSSGKFDVIRLDLEGAEMPVLRASIEQTTTIATTTSTTATTNNKNCHRRAFCRWSAMPTSPLPEAA
ncbi:unnamed protein product [Polarella glacialis]|uniref:Methyltransferase FkbM domain-containing protein n=1 Tax=Polarella glacialis TaxID=89957 RepID=A0A813IMD3_POLGL|nr:unnamed protein product [Polarella glacialis]